MVLEIFLLFWGSGVEDRRWMGVLSNMHYTFHPRECVRGPRSNRVCEL
jgi:hypothetical protein